MNIDRIAKNVIAQVAPFAIIERELGKDGPALEEENLEEVWNIILHVFNLPDDKWIDAEQFYRAYLAFNAKLSGVAKLIADMVADMAQEALDNGYPQFRPRGMNFVSRQAVCRSCPPEKRFAGLSITAKAGI